MAAIAAAIGGESDRDIVALVAMRIGGIASGDIGAAGAESLGGGSVRRVDAVITTRIGPGASGRIGADIAAGIRPKPGRDI